MNIYPETIDDAHSLIHDLEGLILAQSELNWDFLQEDLEPGSSLYRLRHAMGSLTEAMKLRLKHPEFTGSAD